MTNQQPCTFLAMLLLTAVMACQTNSPSMDTGEPIDARLVYIGSLGNGFDIFTNDTLGSAQEVLTGQPDWEWRPQYLPVRGQLVFNRQDTNGTFRMQMRDSSGQFMPYDTYDLPEWTIAPGGEKAMYERSNGEANDLVLVKTASPKDTTVLVRNGSYNGRVTWGPGSDQFVYISDRTGSNELYLFDLASAKNTRLTQNDLREKYTTWSPYGQQVAVTLARDTLPNDIYVVDIGSDASPRQLTDTPINESEISWSPDGRFIAYHARVDGKDDIFLLNVATGAIRKVTKGDGYYGEPTWMW